MKWLSSAFGRLSCELIFRLHGGSFSRQSIGQKKHALPSNLSHFNQHFMHIWLMSSRKQHTKPKRAHASYVFPRNFLHILAKLTISIAINVPKACLIMNELTSNGDWMREKDGKRKKFFFIDQFEWQFTTNCVKRFIWSRAARAAFMVNLLGWRISQTRSDLRFKGFGS
jgi:hypothetical protein